MEKGSEAVVKGVQIAYVNHRGERVPVTLSPTEYKRLAWFLDDDDNLVNYLLTLEQKPYTVDKLRGSTKAQYLLNTPYERDKFIEEVRAILEEKTVDPPFEITILATAKTKIPKYFFLTLLPFVMNKSISVFVSSDLVQSLKDMGFKLNEDFKFASRPPVKDELQIFYRKKSMFITDEITEEFETRTPAGDLLEIIKSIQDPSKQIPNEIITTKLADPILGALMKEGPNGNRLMDEIPVTKPFDQINRVKLLGLLENKLTLTMKRHDLERIFGIFGDTVMAELVYKASAGRYFQVMNYLTCKSRLTSEHVDFLRDVAIQEEIEHLSPMADRHPSLQYQHLISQRAKSKPEDDQKLAETERRVKALLSGWKKEPTRAEKNLLSDYSSPTQYAEQITQIYDLVAAIKFSTWERWETGIFKKGKFVRTEPGDPEPKYPTRIAEIMKFAGQVANATISCNEGYQKIKSLLGSEVTRTFTFFGVPLGQRELTTQTFYELAAKIFGLEVNIAREDKEKGAPQPSGIEDEDELHM